MVLCPLRAFVVAAALGAGLLLPAPAAADPRPVPPVFKGEMDRVAREVNAYAAQIKELEATLLALKKAMVRPTQEEARKLGGKGSGGARGGL